MAAHSSGAGSPVSSDQEAEEEYHSATEDQSHVGEKCPDPDSNSEVESGVAGLCVSEAEEEASDEVGGAKERVELSEEQIKVGVHTLACLYIQVTYMCIHVWCYM